VNTIEYVRFEVNRQNSSLYAEFEDALCYARTAPSFSRPVGMKSFVQNIALRVEPNKNEMRVDESRRGWTTNLRRSEVGFLHGGKAVRASEVPRTFDRWASLCCDLMRSSRYPGFDEQVADNLIKHLLDIHPWKDGNGRTASILRNWMLDTLWKPTILPYYYGPEGDK
jgi:hypothetical protein